MAHCAELDTLVYPSWFSEVHQQPKIEQFYVDEQFRKDENPYKIDLAFSAYRDEDSKPWVFPVVRTAEKVLANDFSLQKEYLHPFGYDSFCQTIVKLLLGDDHPARIDNRAFGIQTLSASGAVRIGAEFLSSVLGKTTLVNAAQSIEFMNGIFFRAGFQDYKEYRYFNRCTLSLDIKGMLADLKETPEGSIIYLQPSAHNPTGCDPTQADWQRIADVVMERKLFPFFECSYQGFATGDPDEDVSAIRYFANRGIEFFCALSLSKTFSLYSERVGGLIIVLNSPIKVSAIKSHLLDIIKAMYGTPPSHGARVATFILGDKSLSDEWKSIIASIAERIKRMREYMREELERVGAPGTWTHVTSQAGNFCYTGLNEIQVQHMKKQHHIYMLSSGRLTISGLNPDNVEYVVRCMNQTLAMIPPSYILKRSI